MNKEQSNDEAGAYFFDVQSLFCILKSERTEERMNKEQRSYEVGRTSSMCNPCSAFLNLREQKNG